MPFFVNIIADDFGYGYNRNRGIVKCYEKGAITGTSLLVNCKYSLDAVNLAKKHGIPTGLHFNLTEGIPLCKRINSSLTCGKGRFLGKQRFWKNRSIDKDAIRDELIAQINCYKKWFNHYPYRVDGHQHIHVHPCVYTVFAEVLHSFGISETRLPLEHPLSNKLIDLTETLSLDRKVFHDTMQRFAQDALVTWNHYLLRFSPFCGLNFMGCAMNTALIKECLSSIQRNDCSERADIEIMTHPGFISNRTTDGFIGDDFADNFSCSLDREHEMSVLTSSDLIQFYKLHDMCIQHFHKK